LEAKLEEDLSNIPRRKGSIDVHIVESQTKSSTEATTVKAEGKSACTMKYSVSRNNLYDFEVLCGIFTDTLKIIVQKCSSDSAYCCRSSLSY
jgi:hypothetical protein